MKQHKHASLIKAWADGAQIEFKCGEEWLDFMSGTNNWHEHLKYRIKPREFENGAFYPVVMNRYVKYFACYKNGSFYLTGMGSRLKLEKFDWVGDKLEIDWPE